MCVFRGGSIARLAKQLMLLWRDAGCDQLPLWRARRSSSGGSGAAGESKTAESSAGVAAAESDDGMMALDNGMPFAVVFVHVSQRRAVFCGMPVVCRRTTVSKSLADVQSFAAHLRGEDLLLLQRVEVELLSLSRRLRRYGDTVQTLLLIDSGVFLWVMIEVIVVSCQ